MLLVRVVVTVDGVTDRPSTIHLPLYLQGDAVLLVVFWVVVGVRHEVCAPGKRFELAVRGAGGW
jgi:hypothetical protein